MRFHWLLLTLLSALLWANPAQAGKLLFWRFESNQNRLVFSTDERVQPRAQLIPNPTRIVIDLPGVVLGRPSVDQSVSGTVRSVRVGQFNPNTTRLVIELAPNYTVNPQEVKVRGISPTQWTVTLPSPQRVAPSNNNSLPPPIAPPPDTPNQSNRALPPANQGNRDDTSDVRVTRNGIFVRLDQTGDRQKLRVKRSKNQRTVEITLPGAQFPSRLASKTLAINEYGIEEIQFEQTETSASSARLTLTVDRQSPDWQAVYSRTDGIVLLPKGGFSNLERQGLSQPRSLNVADGGENQPATIRAVSLSNDNRQLVIQADRSIQGSGQWDARSGVYEIRIDKAQLAESVQGPQLGRNSPIYQLRVRQEAGNTVTILVQPSLGVQFGSVNQLSTQQLALEIQSLRALPPSASRQGSVNAAPRPIAVPPAPYPENNPRTTVNANPPPARQVGRRLVIIDPGHGGKDPGAIGLQGLREKDVILPIAQEVANILEKQGIQIIMTRNSDYFVSLQGRTDMANRAGADIFVSIHANSMGKDRPDVSGMEVYYYGDRRLSDTIHRSIRRSVSLKDRGVRQARFYVLRYSRMPATLVEVGFVTGYEDSVKLSNASFRSQMAQAIARGILEYLQQNR